MSSGLFGGVNLVSKGLEASWLRNQALANNIANVDTPEYKRRDIKFQDYLNEALKGNMEVQPELIVDNSELSYRMDGNNVDVDVEMTRRAKNELYYNALSGQVSHQFKQIQAVLNAK